MDKIITRLGKFESEHESVPHFWQLILDGNASSEWDSDGVLYATIDLIQKDFDEWPELAPFKYVVLWELDKGFVYSSFETGQHE